MLTFIAFLILIAILWGRQAAIDIIVYCILSIIFLSIALFILLWFLWFK